MAAPHDAFEPDEMTGRTALAVEALHASQGVHMENVGIRRTLARMKGWWGALSFLVVVGGVGYIVRDRLEHFATKEKVEANSEEIERQKAELKAMNATLSGIIATQNRTLDGVEDVKRILMNERRR